MTAKSPAAPSAAASPSRVARTGRTRRAASKPVRAGAGGGAAWPLAPLPLVPDSLAVALDGAAQALAAIRAGTALPQALAAIAAVQHDESGHGAIQDIAYRTLRVLGLADALCAKLLQKAPPPHVGNLLACALALLAEAPEVAAYAPFTVVDQAVDAIAARKELHFAKGLVNAVLRNFLRGREVLLAEVQQDPVARWNAPAWWLAALQRAWPDTWQDICMVDRQQGPLTLRVNRRHGTTEDYLQQLTQAGIAAQQVGPQALRLVQAVPVERLPGFERGAVSVQDAGAQLAAPLLNPQAGMRVLDACAAPGGKSGHLLELADIELVALESDAQRAVRIEQNLRRLGLTAQVVVGDASDPAAWWDGRQFDRILADVPCSASGIVRRHPDIRWLRRATDIAALAELQRRIVKALWRTLAPGGEMVYVTCSIFPEEGEMQARWFESEQQDAVRLAAPGQLLPTVAKPGTEPSTDHDGFFYARFQKR